MRTEPEHVPKEDGWCGYLTTAMGRSQHSLSMGIDHVKSKIINHVSNLRLYTIVQDLVAASFSEFLVP